MPSYHPGKGNVVAFQKEVGDLLRWATHDKPVEITRKVALDVRSHAEKNTPVGVDYEFTRKGKGKQIHHGGSMKRAWAAGVGLIKDRAGGATAAEAEVAKWTPGKALYVYNAAFYAWFIEHGWTNRGKNGTTHPGRHILRGAVDYAVNKWSNKGNMVRK